MLSSNSVAASGALALPALLALLGAGCGDDSRPAGGPLGTCGGYVHELAQETPLHVAPDSPITFSTNPPATGKHYSAWAGWYRSYAALGRGYWLHNAEHGGVILLHNCPAGCADDVAGLVALAQARPQDPLCAPPIKSRVLVVADPALPAGTKIAAVAWNAYYTASCLDPAALTEFIDDHYARGPEDLCGDGLAMGGARIP